MNHRQGKRHRVLVLADINTVEHQHKPVLIYNVSHDGMYLVSGMQLAVGTSLTINIGWPHSNTHLAIPAVVMFSSKNGAGVLIWSHNKEISDFISFLCKENEDRLEDEDSESDADDIYCPIFRSL